MKYRTGYAADYIAGINGSSDRFILKKDSRPINTIKEMIETSAMMFPDNTAVCQKFRGDSKFSEIKYRELMSDVEALGTALISHGMKGKHIAVIGENSYYWAISYLAAVCGTGVVVPVDKELGDEEILSLLKNADVDCVIFSPRFRKLFSESRSTKKMMLCEMANVKRGVILKEDGDRVVPLNALIAEGRTLLDKGDRSFSDAEIDTDEMSVLLFTSGTTGLSKGVMLSHRNICTDLMSAPVLLSVYEDDLFFSVLPLHHTYECTCGFLMPLYKGAAIGYCRGLKYLQKDLKELRPTFFLGVPLIFEKFYNTIWKNVRKKKKEKMVKVLLKISRLAQKRGIEKPNPLLEDIRNAFGGRLRFIIAGGAAINPEVLEFYNDLGFMAVQGYGLTECSPMAALNPGKREFMKNDSVGHVIPMAEIRIENENEEGVGEICIKGQNVMLGYYKMPKETEKVLSGGWFHSGDLGYLDDEGFLYITGRKKSVIIAGNGKNVYPEELEYVLCQSSLIEEAFVFAADNENGKDKVIAACIRPDSEALEETGDSEVSLIWDEVDRINEGLPGYKKIKKVIVRKREFDKTTSQKIRRFSEDNMKE